MIITKPCYSSEIILNKCIIRDDNSFVLYNDVHSLRQDIPKNDQIILKKFVNKLSINKQLTNEIFIYKIEIAPLNSYLYAMIASYNQLKKVYLFTYNLNINRLNTDPLEYDNYYAFNFDNGFASNKILANNFEIESFNEIERTTTFILSQRVHKGNAYNSLIKRYYKVDTTGSVTFLYEFEPIAEVFDIKISRLLHDNVISTYLIDNGEYKKIGSYIINKKTNQVESITLIDKSKEYLLIRFDN